MFLLFIEPFTLANFTAPVHTQINKLNF